MKHAVPKGDKKRKKQVMSEIAVLEAEMEKRHQAELDEIKTMVQKYIILLISTSLGSKTVHKAKLIQY